MEKQTSHYLLLKKIKARTTATMMTTTANEAPTAAPTLPPLLSPSRLSFIARNSIRNASNKYKCELTSLVLLAKQMNAKKYCNYKKHL